MSRSIGDTIAHRVGVVPVADVKTVELTSNDRMLIFGPDGRWGVVVDPFFSVAVIVPRHFLGVWEFISNEEAVKLCSLYLQLSPQLVSNHGVIVSR
jgi:hypothetical protein